MFALGAAVGHVPRMSMGRNRYSVDLAGAGDAGLQAYRQLTPEAREVASRTLLAGAWACGWEGVADGWAGGGCRAGS